MNTNKKNDLKLNLRRVRSNVRTSVNTGKPESRTQTSSWSYSSSSSYDTDNGTQTVEA